MCAQKWDKMHERSASVRSSDRNISSVSKNIIRNWSLRLLVDSPFILSTDCYLTISSMVRSFFFVAFLLLLSFCARVWVRRGNGRGHICEFRSAHVDFYFGAKKSSDRSIDRQFSRNEQKAVCRCIFEPQFVLRWPFAVTTTTTI